jgi:hypothetical protein
MGKPSRESQSGRSCSWIANTGQESTPLQKPRGRPRGSKNKLSQPPSSKKKPPKATSQSNFKSTFNDNEDSPIQASKSQIAMAARKSRRSAVVESSEDDDKVEPQRGRGKFNNIAASLKDDGSSIKGKSHYSCYLTYLVKSSILIDDESEEDEDLTEYLSQRLPKYKPKNNMSATIQQKPQLLSVDEEEEMPGLEPEFMQTNVSAFIGI